MSVFIITETTTVATLKEQFERAFGGRLRVYKGRLIAKDDDLLVSLGASIGRLECSEFSTVEAFCNDFLSTLNLKVKVWTKDYWVEVLPEITLFMLQDLPKQATKEDLKAFLTAYWDKEFQYWKSIYQRRWCSLLLIDPRGAVSMDEFSGELRSIYVDLSDFSSLSRFVSPNKLCSTLLEEGYQGLILDHVDQIVDVEQSRDWEYLVKWSLKRDSVPIHIEETMRPKGTFLDFGELAVVVRSSEYPTYLTQADLQAPRIAEYKCNI